MNKAVGFGFEGLPAADVLDDIERTFADHRAGVAVELCTLADPGSAPLLCDRGYRLVGFENVLGCALPAAIGSAGEPRVGRADPGQSQAWVDVIVDGFAYPDGAGAPSHEEFPRTVIADGTWLSVAEEHVAQGVSPLVHSGDPGA
ncbi:hypothetical protein [Mycobacterium kyogaense]|uniref:hypothetical protein n=1 Tax=Mycobacterium kyogaense TaxID=2212479 RepID=UPI000DAB9A60|nr:hypothetical protein [Mycobacterium kyogaense]